MDALKKMYASRFGEDYESKESESTETEGSGVAEYQGFSGSSLMQSITSSYNRIWNTPDMSGSQDAETVAKESEELDEADFFMVETPASVS